MIPICKYCWLPIQPKNMSAEGEDEPWFICPGSKEMVQKYPTYGLWQKEDEIVPITRGTLFNSRHVPMDPLEQLAMEAQDAAQESRVR